VTVDWQRIQSQWPHFKVLAQARWGRISAADFDLIAGRRDLLVTHIQQMYGISNNAAQMQLESWQGRQQEPEAA
jgi:uncharacterized protein YjbJ (UPF0337 family)